MIPLSQLDAGMEARLVSIDGERAFRCRLMELGLLPDTRVRMVRRVDVGGLVEIEVRGSRLSIRRSEAQHLMVEQATPRS